MSGPVRGAVIGALLYEGLAGTPEEAERLAGRRRALTFDPCHHHARGRADGRAHDGLDARARRGEPRHRQPRYSTLNEGLGKVLRYGAFAPDVLERLRWFRDVARARARRGAAADRRRRRPRA